MPALLRFRAVLGTWFDAEMMIQTGLYPRGSDPAIDRAIALWPAIDAFCAAPSADVANSFGMLGKILDTTGKPVSKA